MSRTKHKLQSETWYGQWAAYFHKENRETRKRGREKRQKMEDDMLDQFEDWNEGL